MINHAATSATSGTAPATHHAPAEVVSLARQIPEDYVDFFLRRVLDIDEPFGGIQVLFMGDFMQLPPVSSADHGYFDWAFYSHSWVSANIKCVALTKVYRQADGPFVEMLNRIRMGDPPTPEQWELLRGCLVPADELSEATFITPYNRKVDSVNQYHLAKLPGDPIHIPAIFDIRDNHIRGNMTREVVRKQLCDTTIMRSTLSLKIGCRVMLLKNDVALSYVNGSQGILENINYDQSEERKIVSLTIYLDRCLVPITLDQIERGEDPRRVTVHRHTSTRGNHEPEEDVAHVEDPETGELVGWDAAIEEVKDQQVKVCYSDTRSCRKALFRPLRSMVAVRIPSSPGGERVTPS
ncbi:PIF1-like helicase [Rubritalea squalenifaciens DSM 18772]|uniref:PIF1-like helicase n=1 Tax=Rubritalea squalenifaciens DSM 18772 TaxID=1123071 RepID=A0A1M6GHQ3_9BACT|nr:hypothetical protein [Rubritalea squalenifaciens]SHJ09440.1 PIF1-like helicase [Rubritalea squalenifaciens DSM 18772]